MTPDRTPTLTGDFTADAAAFAHLWATLDADLARLPDKPHRAPAQQESAQALLAEGRAARDRFLSAHVGAVYGALTEGLTRFRRVDDLAYAAAELVPGLTPTRARVAAEAARKQADKDGWEIDQGLFLAHVLASPAAGRHLCHAMLLPRPETAEWLARLERDGEVQLATARVTRRGNATLMEQCNASVLNAEDESMLDDFEIAIDLAILDPASLVAVMRGGVVTNRKYAGRRVFCAGINLTQLYHGGISYLWYIRRDMGPVNKMLRGVAAPDSTPDGPLGGGVEKPWIAAVDTFAIGGGCQLLLVSDFVLAARDAYMTLPARKEGIIPGAANLRLPRFTGDRIARQAIGYGLRLDCDSPAGRLICDEIAEPEAMDAALDGVVHNLTNSGAVSLVGNRRALRIGQEPLDAFRSYMSIYAREQAICHFSPALIANLETHWRAHERRV